MKHKVNIVRVKRIIRKEKAQAARQLNAFLNAKRRNWGPGKMFALFIYALHYSNYSQLMRRYKI